MVSSGQATPRRKSFPIVSVRENGTINVSMLIQQAKELIDRSLYDATKALRNLRRSLLDKIGPMCEKEDERCQMNIILSLYNPSFRSLAENQSNRFLYPPGYQRVGTPPREEDLDEINMFFNNRHYCGTKWAIEDLLFGTEENYQIMLNRLASRKRRCHESILTDIWTILSDVDFPDNCNELIHRDLEVCTSMMEDRKLIDRRVSALIDTIKPKGMEKYAFEVCLSQQDIGPSISPVVNSFLDDIYEYRRCEPYLIGNERVHNHSRGGGYIITKTAPGVYTASVALGFFPAEDYDNGNVPADQVHSHYLQRVRDCMEETNRYMLGPGGTRLSIDVQDAHQEHPDLAPISQVSIQSSQGRSYVTSYESDINCELITHEVMHLLGLCDEYEEKMKGETVDAANGDASGSIFLSKHNCRVTQDNSIMANQGERFRNVRDGRNDSLLDPTHFNTILYPGCESREDTKLYKMCSSLAYTTDHTGPKHSCSDPQKKRCEQSNVLGRDKQSELDRLNTELDRLNTALERTRAPIRRFIVRFIEPDISERIQQRIQQIQQRIDVMESWD